MIDPKYMMCSCNIIFYSMHQLCHPWLGGREPAASIALASAFCTRTAQKAWRKNGLLGESYIHQHSSQHEEEAEEDVEGEAYRDTEADAAGRLQLQQLRALSGLHSDGRNGVGLPGAYTWSTVVLLGGFVTTLGNKDFWCLTIISMTQAARIFNDLEDHQFANFFQVYILFYRNVRAGGVDGVLGGTMKIVILSALLLLGFIYVCGSVICLVLSSWRIVQRDYGSNQGDESKANLVPALDLFYSLVLCQSVLFSVWLWFSRAEKHLVIKLCRECKFPEKWGRESARAYLSDTRARCWRNPVSIRGRRLINYVVDLLDSGPQKDYLSGARMLDTFIEMEVDVRSLILPSKPRIQRLIDTLGWKSSNKEIRELAARIVAYLAGHIHLTQFPGAIQCISSLLDTVVPYWNNQQQPNQSAPNMKLDSSIDDSDGEDWNELILQGLTILERLASDQHNCRDICSTPDLLPKIMAPIYSDTLMQDIHIKEWANIVNRSFRVVHQLIRAPGWTGRRLRCEISSNKQAVGNLKGILDNGDNAGPELLMRAMDVMTELALDLSTNLTSETKENLIKKQLQIFLIDDQRERKATTIELKVTAGKTMASLSKTGSICAFITRECNDIVDHLTGMLDSKNTIAYRTIAAEILENLCRYALEKESVENTLLLKVLSEILPSTRKPKESANDEEIGGFCSEEEDEENQLPKHKSQIELSDQTHEDQTAMMELQGAYLSLTLVICDKLISADDEAQMILPEEGEFVAKLKAIIKENSQATPQCLRIVKLCVQIAISVMRRGLYMAQFKAQKFKPLLSKASKKMSKLESCIPFAGTDCRTKKTVRPLVKDLVEEALELVYSPQP